MDDSLWQEILQGDEENKEHADDEGLSLWRRGEGVVPLFPTPWEAHEYRRLLRRRAPHHSPLHGNTIAYQLAAAKTYQVRAQWEAYRRNRQYTSARPPRLVHTVLEVEGRASLVALPVRVFENF